MVNKAQIKVDDRIMRLESCELNRAGAGRLAFVLQYWSLWELLPTDEDLIDNAILPVDRNQRGLGDE